MQWSPKHIAKALYRRLCRKSGRDFIHEPNLTEDDIFLISYPRSGNTWIRAIVSFILYPQEQVKSIKALNYLVPDVHRGIPKGISYSTPRVIKTHRAYPLRHERQNDALYNHSIYVVRHPYQVLASYYHYLYWDKADTARPTFERYIDMVTQGAIDPGNWQQHVLSWHVMREERDLLFIRYEDTQNDTVKVIQQIGEWLGKPCTEHEAEAITALTSREAMVQLEQREPLRKSQEFEFVRRDPNVARMNVEWTETLKQKVWEHNAQAMRLFGYVE